MKVEGSLEFTVVERTAERVVSEMPIAAGNTNPFGVVHAGAMLWFADVTATILVREAKETDGVRSFPLAINLSAQFVSNQKDGILRAVATFVKNGRTVSVVRTEVRGAENRLLADVTTSHVLAK